MDEGRALTLRVRGALWILLLSNLAFALGDGLMARAAWPSLLLFRLFTVVTMAACLALLRGRPTKARATGIGLAASMFVLAGSGFAGFVGGDPERTTLIAVIVAMGCAALLPWGVRAQAALSLVAALTAAAPVVLESGYAAPHGYLLATALVGIACSVAMAHQNDRLRSGLRTAIDEAERRDRVLREAMEHVRDVLWMTNATGDEVLYVSPAYEEIWGRPTGDLYRRSFDWIAGVHPDDRERVAQAFDPARGRDDYAEEYRIVRPDGSLRWIRERRFVVRRADGLPVRVAGVAQDITERRSVEAAEHSRSLAAHLDATRDATWRRLAEQLHDGAAQELTALSLSLGGMAGQSEAEEARLRDMAQIVERTIATVRTVSEELRPSILENFGLTDAIRWQASEFERITGVPCIVEGTDAASRYSRERAAKLFRIVRDTLVDIAEHGGHGPVRVRLEENDDAIVLAVRDEGHRLEDALGEAADGIGVPGLSGLLDGSLEIRREEGAGTEIRVTLPAQPIDEKDSVG